MDLVLEICDGLLFDKMWANIVPLSATRNVLNNTSSQWLLPLPQMDLYSYPITSTDAPISAWPRDYIPRQLFSLIILTVVGIHVLYFLFAWLSYKFIFNHDMMRHPRFLKSQIKLEIQTSLWSFPGMTLLTLPWFQGEVMGYSKLYRDVDQYGWLYLVFSVPFFLFFTDYLVYWVHRLLHHPIIYKTIHKPHHRWIIPTPFSSHAFHPVDGYMQSIPYHLFIFIFPLHRILYLILFVFVNIWSILIHDSDMVTGHPLEKIINGPAHHTLHHLYFTVNYGQYFTWADRVGGSYRQPESHLDPKLEVNDAPTEKVALGKQQ